MGTLGQQDIKFEGTAEGYARVRVPANATMTLTANGSVTPIGWFGEPRVSAALKLRVQDENEAQVADWYDPVGFEDGTYAPKPWGPVVHSLSTSSSGRNMYVAIASQVVLGTDFKATVSVSFSGGGSPEQCEGISADETQGGNPASPNVDKAQGDEADPVNTATGNFNFAQSDLSFAGRVPGMTVGRSYNSLDAAAETAFGYGWSWTYGTRLEIAPSNGPVTMVQETGARLKFKAWGSKWFAPSWAQATLVHETDGNWTVTRRGVQVFRFDSSGLLTAVKDLNGNTATVSYASGKVSEVADGTGRKLTFGWTGNRITTVCDGASPCNTSSAGRKVTYSYTNGDLTGMTDVGGGAWAFGYSGTTHRLTTVRDPRQAGVGSPPQLSNTYDSNGRVTLQVNRNGKSTVFDYTTIPGATKVTDPTGRIVVDYYSDGIRTKTVRGQGTAEEATWLYEYDSQTLGITKVTDPLLHVSTATYDPQGNQTSATDPLTRTRSATWNSLNLPLTSTDWAGTTTTFTYSSDGRGNLTSRSTPLVGSSPAQTQTVTYHYDDTAHTGDVTSIDDARGKTWTYHYNSYGLVDWSTDPLLNKTTYEDFTTAGWPQTRISPRGNAAGATKTDFKTAYTFNAYGDVLTVTDPTAHTTTRTFDANRNLATVQDPGGNCSATPKVGCTLYGYDPDDRLTTITRPDGSVLTNTYFDNDLLKQQIDAASAATAYTYDALGRLKTETDPAGNVTGYGYDLTGNLTSKQDPGGNCVTNVKCTKFTYDDASQLQTVTYSDGTAPNITAIGYDTAGRRNTTTNSLGGVTSWNWDSLGRLTSSVSNGQTTGYGYDLAGNVTKITYPGYATPVTRTYDDAGRFTATDDTAGNTTNFGYDADANLRTTTFPSSVNVDSYDVDNAGRITDSTFKKGTTTLGRIQSPRTDPFGRISGETLTSLPGGNSTYGYTPLSQVDTINSTNQFDYDAANNPIKVGATNQAFNSANQLCWTSASAGSGCGSAPTGAVTYSFDNRGNRITQARPDAPDTTYSYDQANRLTSADVPAVQGNQGQFHELTPTRILNTPSGFVIGTCNPSPCQRMSTNTIKVKVLGEGGIPTTGVEAVTMDVTAYNTYMPLYAGAVTVWRSDGTQPAGRSLYFASGANVSNRVTTKVGADGYVSLNVVGDAEISFDVQGWYSTATGTAGGNFVSLDPTNVLDTRSATRNGACPTSSTQCTTLAANTTRTFQVTGRAGVPATGVSAVSVNITAYNAAADGHVKVYRSGTQPVPYITTYYTTGKTVSIASDLKLSASGQLDVYSSAGLDVTVDVVGYWTSPTAQEGGQYIPLDPAQVLDTNGGTGTCTPSPCARIPAGTTLSVQLAGLGGLPTTGIKAVNLNITTYNGSATGAVEVWPSDENPTGLRTLAFAPSTFTSNSLPMDIGADGRIKIKAQSSAAVDIYLNVQGYYSESGTVKWSYAYDNDGMRISKTSPTGTVTAYTWDKSNLAAPLLLTEKTGTATTRYIYGPGGIPIEQINPNGSITYLHRDQLGSTRLTTNSAGNTQGTATYNPYGTTNATTGTLGTPFGYAGQYTDTETGLQYLRARYYDPTTAQFLSLDPLHTLTGERYGYTGGNPLNATDPTGMWAMGALRMIGQVAVVGAAVLGGMACGASIVCGVAVGAAAGFAGYAAANAGSNRWSWNEAIFWTGVGGIAGWFGGASAGRTATVFRAVEVDELADIAASGQFRAIAGQEGKYFFPTQAQAENFAGLMSKAGNGRFCITSGCIDAGMLSKVEQISIAGEGPAWFIPEELLPYIRDIVTGGWVG